MRLIRQFGNYRIIEEVDTTYSMKDLKGDCFHPSNASDTLSLEDLARDEKQFEEEVERSGVYGYTLERWNPEIGKGWEDVSSCWGFVGQYDSAIELYNHYIVDELIGIAIRDLFSAEDQGDLRAKATIIVQESSNVD